MVFAVNMDELFMQDHDMPCVQCYSIGRFGPKCVLGKHGCRIGCSSVGQGPDFCPGKPAFLH